ncbi:MAG: hypothetical protein PUB69_04370 [Desulfovibrionaceae bacterium]|nr:hypothetical protein [Desulfovibrionaceae bacterium]
MPDRPGYSILISPDSRFLRARQEELCCLFPASPKWERQVFWAEREGLADDFWNIGRSFSLIPANKMIIVREANLFDEKTWKRISTLLSRPLRQIWIVLCFESPWKKNQFVLPEYVKKSPCFAFAQKKNWIWSRPGLTAATMRRYVTEQAAGMRLKLSDRQIHELVSALPLEASAVYNELNRIDLLHRVFPGKDINSADSGTFNIFDFMTMLREGRSAEVWKMLLREESRGSDFFFLLQTLLHRELCQLWQILSNDPALRFLFPAEERQKRSLAQRLGKRTIVQLFDCLFDNETKIKNGMLSPEQGTERLVACFLQKYSVPKGHLIHG